MYLFVFVLPLVLRCLLVCLCVSVVCWGVCVYATSSIFDTTFVPNLIVDSGVPEGILLLGWLDYPPHTHTHKHHPTPNISLTPNLWWAVGAGLTRAWGQSKPWLELEPYLVPFFGALPFLLLLLSPSTLSKLLINQFTPSSLKSHTLVEGAAILNLFPVPPTSFQNMPCMPKYSSSLICMHAPNNSLLTPASKICHLCPNIPDSPA